MFRRRLLDSQFFIRIPFLSRCFLRSGLLEPEALVGRGGPRQPFIGAVFEDVAYGGHVHEGIAEARRGARRGLPAEVRVNRQPDDDA